MFNVAEMLWALLVFHKSIRLPTGRNPEARYKRVSTWGHAISLAMTQPLVRAHESCGENMDSEVTAQGETCLGRNPTFTTMHPVDI